MSGYVSESTVDSRPTETEASDTEWLSASVSVRRLAPAAEVDEETSDFKFCDGQSSGGPHGPDSFLPFDVHLQTLNAHTHTEMILHLAR